MYSEARKLHLIEEVLKIKSEAILIEIEALLRKGLIKQLKKNELERRKPSDYAGCISPEKATDLLQQVEQSRNEWERDT